MTQPRSLAAAQTVPVPGDLQANLEQHVEMAERAAAEGATVVVFPELSLTGYELGLAHDLALSEDDPRLQPLTEVAAASVTTLIVGGPVRIGTQLHIGAFILTPDGTVQVYTKHHLGAFPDSVNPGGTVPPAEATVFQAGERNPLVQFGEHMAAVAICADLRRASHAEQAAERGARTYLACAFVIPTDLEGDIAKLQGYAERHAMAVVFSNFGGPSGGLPSAGRSAVWSETGELIVQLDGLGPGLAIAIEGPNGWRSRAVTLGGLGAA